MKYHMIAFAAGFLLDLIVGDPYCLPHPIRMIGNLIAGLEKKLLKLDGAREDRQELLNGCVLVCAVLFVTGIVSVTILFGAYYVNRWLGIAVETIMTYQILATKCLKVESMKVYKSLKEEGLEAARKSVSMIVGRDTAVLDEIGVTKAAVWASFATGVGITVSNMFLHYIASSINAGAIAMIAGLIVVLVVSFVTPKLQKERVDDIFACYDEKVTITKKRSLAQD